MRTSFVLRRLSLALLGLSLAAPGAASAGGARVPFLLSNAGAAGPAYSAGPRNAPFTLSNAGAAGPAVSAPRFTGPHIISLGHGRRGERRRHGRFLAEGYLGSGLVGGAAPAVIQNFVETGGGLRPPAAVYYLPHPVVAQGDHGYTAQPAIYNVAKVLRDYPVDRRVRRPRR